MSVDERTDAESDETFMAHQPISLANLNAVAALQTRKDRKYLVGDTELHAMLDALGPHHRILEIDDKREFAYESAYFDTAELDLYRAAATSRRRRYKVRTRTYVDSGLCMLEVKTKDGRGQTAKHRFDYDVADRDRLTKRAGQFISAVATHVPVDHTLARVLTTSYDRSTFVDLDSATRVTIDRNLVCTDAAGRHVVLNATVVETKSAAAPSPTDRWLWAAGHRPIKVSKFCTGLAALHPELRSNKWHRALQHDWR